MENNTERKAVNYRAVFREIKKRAWIYLITIPVVGVLSAIYIYSIPREYTTSTEIVPEVDNATSAAGGLSSIASTFGIDLGSSESSDAITPLLYPDLMNDNGFVHNLFNIHVQDKDGTISTDYYHYLKDHQKKSWISSLLSGFANLFSTKKNKPTVNKVFKAKDDPYILTKDDDDIMKKIRDDISIKVDKKTNAITIITVSQDPFIAKTIADSTMARLQVFITKYRTNKARKDVEYYKKLMTDAKTAYDKQRHKYAAFVDANEDVVLQSIRSQQEEIENEMQMRYNTYTALSAQLQAAIAKLRKMTPVFMTIQGASVPIKPEKPKRMFFVLGWVLFAFFVTSIYVLRDIIAPKE